jgi:hypothetical protein
MPGASFIHPAYSAFGKYSDPLTFIEVFANVLKIKN